MIYDTYNILKLITIANGFTNKLMCLGAHTYGVLKKGGP